MSTYEKILQSVEFLKSKTALRPTLGVVLGSGLGSFGNLVKKEFVARFEEIPNFHKPSVVGHGGQLIFGTLEGVPLIVQQGRIHYYEGHSMEEVVHPVRVLAQLGVKSVVLTNAAGGIQSGLSPGDLLVIRDHLNLMGANPLRGPNISELGPRFPDMTTAYSKRLRKIIETAYKRHNLRYCEGVYAALAGPTYETAAEIQYLKKIGADAVGMSTVPETIALRHMNVEVVGISCITNMAAGLSSQEISHEEVTETGKRVEKVFANLLTDIIKGMS